MQSNRTFLLWQEKTNVLMLKDVLCCFKIKVQFYPSCPDLDGQEGQNKFIRPQ